MDLPRQASDDSLRPARQTGGWCEQALLQSCLAGLSSYASKAAVSIRCRNELLCDRFRPGAVFAECALQYAQRMTVVEGVDAIAQLIHQLRATQRLELYKEQVRRQNLYLRSA